MSYCCSSAFTLHGLWPEFENGGYPQFCKTANATGPLPPDSAEMRCKWESFMGANSAFWEHEWGASTRNPAAADTPVQPLVKCHLTSSRGHTVALRLRSHSTALQAS